MKKLKKFFKSLNFKEWIELIVLLLIIIFGLMLVVKAVKNINAEDKIAYENCVSETNNKTYCEKQIYGIY